MANPTFNEFKALLQRDYPEFVEFNHDSYRDEFVATTERPETILTYDCEQQSYSYSFNGGEGNGETVEEAKAAFEKDYDRIQRNYELSRLS